MTKRTKTIEQTIESKRDYAREAAVMNTQIRLDGVGEHPAIQAAASPEFATMSNQEALQIALQLQDIAKGQASILQNLSANQALLTEQVVKMNERMKKYDEDAEKWNTDRDKFLLDINEKANKLRVTDPSKRADMAARVMAEEQQMLQIARAERETNKLKFKEMIARAPKVTIVSHGVMETGRIGDQQVTRLAPDVIRIKEVSWVLQPGILTEVPDFVARRFEQIQKSRSELAERQGALSVDRNNGNMTSAEEVTREMARIDQKYGTVSDKT